jgi:hypothetical protein
LWAGELVTNPLLESPATFTPTPEYLAKAETAIEKAVTYAVNSNKWKNERENHAYKAKLRYLAKKTNIFNPDEIKTTILTLITKNKKPASDNTKIEYQCIYRMFSKANNIPFKIDISTLKTKSPIPLIPTTENVNLIINSTKLDWYVPLMIMAKTGIEAMELHKTPQSQIDKTNGKISVVGTKEHDNGTYQLEEPLADALRKYLAIHTEEYPFPATRKISGAWKRARNRLAENNPELKKIPMKNLRNYAGAIYYTTMGKDPIATKNFMRHKRLEQTMAYLRGLTEFTAKTKKIGKLVNTAEEALELVLQGFTEEQVWHAGTPQEKHLLTKINI